MKNHPTTSVGLALDKNAKNGPVRDARLKEEPQQSLVLGYSREQNSRESFASDVEKMWGSKLGMNRNRYSRLCSSPLDVEKSKNVNLNFAKDSDENSL